VNYLSSNSLSLREGIRSTFAQDVICAIDIRTDDTSIFRAIQSISPSNPLSTKDVLLLVIWLIVGDRIKVKKARFTGIGLFRDLYLDSNQCCFVGDHINEPGMRNAHKVLVRLPSHSTLLLPKGVFPNDNRSRSLFNQKINDAPACGMQVVIDLPVARIGNPFHLCRYTLSIC